MILLSDFAADVGDLGVVANACAWHRLGHIDLLGIMCGTSKDKAPGGIDAVRVYYNIPDGEIAIGTWKGAAFNPGAGPAATWPGYIYDNYPHDVGANATVPDSITEIRRLLAARTTPDVVIVEAGPCNTLAAFLDSTADEHSELAGSALIEASVSRLYVMGGHAPSNGSSEWNFEQHPTSAAQVCDDWPTPVVFAGFSIATDIENGTGVSTFDTGNLLLEAYDDAGYPSGRTAWDEMTLLAAVWQDSSFTLTRGTNAVDTETGVNTFTPGAGDHYYLTRTLTAAGYEAILNALMVEDASGDPLIASWAPGMAWARVSIG